MAINASCNVFLAADLIRSSSMTCIPWDSRHLHGHLHHICIEGMYKLSYLMAVWWLSITTLSIPEFKKYLESSKALSIYFRPRFQAMFSIVDVVNLFYRLTGERCQVRSVFVPQGSYTCLDLNISHSCVCPKHTQRHTHLLVPHVCVCECVRSVEALVRVLGRIARIQFKRENMYDWFYV